MSGKLKDWPPVISKCPDYWEIDGLNNELCVNIKDLGTDLPSSEGSTHTKMNFNIYPYNNDCTKYRWAKSYNLAWDGITYGVVNPCSDDTPNL